MTLTLTSLPLNTPTNTIKQHIQTHLGGPSAVDAAKIKILLNKKPIPSSKTTLGDAFEGSDVADKEDVSLSVMVMGGAPDPAADAPGTIDMSPDAGEVSKGAESGEAAAEAVGGSGTRTEMEGVQSTTTTEEDELAKPEFWADLEAFLGQRLKGSGKAVEVRGVFEKAWRSRTAKP
jgi:ubiquitin-like protein 4